MWHFSLREVGQRKTDVRGSDKKQRQKGPGSNDLQWMYTALITRHSVTSFALSWELESEIICVFC